MLGVDKDGSEWYQVTLGGSDGTHAQRRGRAGQGDRPVASPPTRCPTSSRR
ncbi:MAG: hypothetical protein MZW92_70300 [Comamonadaceae bacterium]|nr:hypothetical protein [Comamonadaceae bacterium]